MADEAEQSPLAEAGAAPQRGIEALVRRGRRPREPGTFEFLHDVELPVNVDVGRTKLKIRDILAMTRGTVVTLEKLSGESVDICIGGNLLAIGEVIVIQDKLRVRVVDLVYPPDRELEDGEDEAGDRE